MGTHPIFESDFDCLTDDAPGGKRTTGRQCPSLCNGQLHPNATNGRDAGPNTTNKPTKRSTAIGGSHNQCFGATANEPSTISTSISTVPSTTSTCNGPTTYSTSNECVSNATILALTSNNDADPNDCNSSRSDSPSSTSCLHTENQ